MEKLMDRITEEVTKVFVAKGYDEKYGKVTLSNRPDLCEFQCNGAMAAAKECKCAPFLISDQIAEGLKGNEMFSGVESVKPGFLNLKLSETFLADYIQKMCEDTGRFGCDKAKEPKTILVDYGGPNVAKPLHVGHLRSAIIGESVKRIGRFMGHKVIGDVHLGDWGLQMGLIIVELKERKPELVYFDEAYERGMKLQQLELSELDVNMFAAVDNSLINDGCGLYRGRQILPYEHLSRFQNDLID